MFDYTKVKFERSGAKNSKSQPAFVPTNITAIDRGIVIPGISDKYEGKAPDIGAYEKDAPVWRAGSSLSYNGKQYAP